MNRDAKSWPATATFHPDFFEAVSFTALAYRSFPGFSEKTRRVWVDQQILEYYSAIPPVPSMQAHGCEDAPICYPKTEYEKIELRWCEWLTDKDKSQRYKVYSVLWGYGPQTDTLAISEADTRVQRTVSCTWQQLLNQD
jgi:hypothetical protein